MDRRHALARGGTLPERTHGAALLADISDFVPLTVSLAQQLGRRRGAEALLARLQPVYQALIAEVLRFGGSVISFAGDAITCWFDDQAPGSRQPATDEVAHSAARRPLSAERAVACALAMQRAMDSQAAAAPALGIKVGVAAGPARRMLVGNPGTQTIESLGGATLVRMAAAEGLAQRGEVLAGAEVLDAIGPRLQVEAWRTDAAGTQRFAVVRALDGAEPADPWPPLPADGPGEERLHAWLHPQVYERLQAGERLLGDLRMVAPLLLRFTGIDFDADDAATAKLDAYVRRVQAVADEYDGALIDLNIGDKGAVLYLAFGAPIAHEDDAARALAAALALQHGPRELDCVGPVQIGIDWGQAWTGICGAGERHTYAVMGAPVNLAARLMVHAQPGQVLASETAAAAAGTRFTCLSLSPMRFKGTAGPIAVAEVVARLSSAPAISTRYTREMVGRRPELGRLLDLLIEVQAGAGRVVFIEGDAGIGKSRLLGAFAAAVRARGLAGFLGSGESIEAHTPYRAWRSLMGTFLGLDGIDAPAGRRARVAERVQALAPEQSERLPLLNDILDLREPENELTSGLAPELRNRSLGLMVQALLEAWARRQPLVMALEDSHWLDSLSWDLALQVVRGLHAHGVAFLLMCVTRPFAEDERSTRATLRAWPGTEIIRLAALGRDEIAALVAGRLNVPPVGLPGELLQLVAQRAEGNPFFAEELLLDLQANGAVAVEAGAEGAQARCTVRGGLAHAAGELPDSVQGLIIARIDRLSTVQQLVIKLAAVLGRKFDYGPLRHLCRWHSVELAATLTMQLAALERQDFTYVTQFEPEPAYMFKHALIQEAAYGMLLSDQRSALHRAAADWYEQRSGAGVAEAADLPLLVYHCSRADDRERERHYARLAGRQATARFAHGEAVAYLTRALALTPDDDVQARYELTLAREDAYHLQGNREAQRRDLADLEQLAAGLGQPGRRGEVARRRARLANALGDWPAAIAAAQETIRWAQAAGDPALEADGELAWSKELMRRAQHDIALAAGEHLVHALALARAAGRRDLEADVLQTLGGMVWFRADYSGAQAYTEQALALYREMGDWQGEANATIYLGTLAWHQGDFVTAREVYLRSLAMCQKIGARREEARTLNNLGLTAFQLGDYGAARESLERSQAVFREIGDRWGEAVTYTGLGPTAIAQGDYAAAENYGRETLALCESLQDRWGTGYALVTLGEALSALGQPAALATLVQAVAVRREVAHEPALMEALASLAGARLAQGQVAQALEAVEEVVAYLESGGNLNSTDFRLRTHLLCYRVLRANGDARAGGVLRAAYAVLCDQAARLPDELTRRAFLEQVPWHRELVAAVRAQRV